jgi:exopolysaccharide production protein ExoZ
LSPAFAPTSLRSLQVLRGIAALSVAIAHLRSVETKFDAATLLGPWTGVGFGGVDLFFVISGFVMVWVTRADQGKAGALPRFWLARFLRIYPLWWLVLSAVVALWLIRPDMVYSSDDSTPDLVRSYLLLPGENLPLHAVGWTLIHEVWFYAIFGMLLLLPARMLPFGLGIWAVGVVVWALAQPSPSHPIIALLRHPLTLEFIAGAAIGILATRGTLAFARPILVIGGFVLLLSALSIRENPQAIFEQEWPRLWLFGLPFALILWGSVGLEQTGDMRAPSWLQRLGDWSYALYLVHVLVFALVGRIAKPLAQPGIIDNIAVMLVAVGVAIFASYLLHNVFEKPVQLMARRLLKPRIKPL